MLEIENFTGQYVARSGELLITFEYSGDRWRHELAICRAGGQQILLSSEEGTPDELDPPSPAFQELRLETIGPDVSEFQLFGQAGKGIYSAAVRFDGNSGTITFDVAARANRPGAEIRDGSTYLVQPTVMTSSLAEEGIFNMHGDGVGLRLSTNSQILTPTAIAESVLIRQPGAVESGELQYRNNARWQYAFQLVPRP